MDDLIGRLRKQPGTTLCRGLQESADELLASSAVRLPGDHVAFLRQANGVLAYHGYVRLFGLACTDCVDLRWWNDRETWKFAWPIHVTSYLVFGENGWGDQYAYDVRGLLSGDPGVFVLDAFEMQPEQIASNYSEFMRDEFIRQAEAPYDPMTRQAFDRLGALSWDEHVTYVPPLVLGGDERIDNVQKINARAGMIINGDLAVQSAEEPDRLPASLDTYQDDAGRLRVRVRWQ